MLPAQRRLWVSHVPRKLLLHTHCHVILYTNLSYSMNPTRCQSLGTQQQSLIAVAKESRDTIIANWKWTETLNYAPQNSYEFGSGYPSDPKCKAWLASNCNVDVPFGFPDFARFSWGPVSLHFRS